MDVPLVIVAVAIAIAVIAAAGLLYFNPSITGILDQSEHERQELIMSQEVRSGSTGYRQVNIIVNGVMLFADVAATDEQRTKGLSVKDRLAENEAMLFVFDNEAKHAFWMKNMKFPIDIIWIDTEKTVVHIEHNLQPCSSEFLCPTYRPVTDSRYVLETVSGFAERYDIVKETMVEFEP